MRKCEKGWREKKTSMKKVDKKRQSEYEKLEKDEKVW